MSVDTVKFNEFLTNQYDDLLKLCWAQILECKKNLIDHPMISCAEIMTIYHKALPQTPTQCAFVQTMSMCTNKSQFLENLKSRTSDTPEHIILIICNDQEILNYLGMNNYIRQHVQRVLPPSPSIQRMPPPPFQNKQPSRRPVNKKTKASVSVMTPGQCQQIIEEINGNDKNSGDDKNDKSNGSDKKDKKNESTQNWGDIPIDGE